MSDIKKIKDQYLLKLSENLDLNQISQIKTDLFGKNGLVSSQFKQLGKIAEEERKKFASDLNNIKDELQNLITLKIDEIETKEINQKLEKEKVDITLPERPFNQGKIHPVSQVIDEISSIFSEIGFSVEEGPDVENEYNNFTALNTPDNHPARDMHDTFYLDEKKELLLRTHTSPVQIRTMLNDKPPFKIIAPGRTYRSDSDQTHAPMFHQVEGLHIDKNINMGHLKGCLNYFIKEFFEVDKIKMRFRPSHFPFTEPSAEVDIGYEIKDGKIIIGEGDKWLEVLGCGMVHPNVLKNVKVNTDEFQGYAFGIGIDRLAMLKYGINDLRAFFDCDYRWLNQFGFDPVDVPSSYRGLSR
ncbi:phenylalanine--tRNA ligase subunit alpha [Candidatus Pelagibacter sp.]|jgi:phenylalanyl-tRNA synthetase alpha chain|nr:phenylalanine--tRNA ligase subunit alpha [Candidatus Pelagibacter sp.]MDB9923136.1 phenylalanine--tRNA ligase subunit alpha [Candidatus Pelagibacter sp.]MDC0908457.1 phenylalanine--tRNA ligase subunit alpha [Candidatus Pelagibacter sp.]|tara:strand:+ start:248 stop:1315 length:1068 start_codon:yes stop_codon:yes gene_type:complete